MQAVSPDFVLRLHAVWGAPNGMHLRMSVGLRPSGGSLPLDEEDGSCLLAGVVRRWLAARSKW
eukprot:11682832-Alexandrium_andersonii.AAC.1